ADIGSADPDLATDLTTVLANGDLDRCRENVDSAPRLPFADVGLEAPTTRPPEFLAVGLNYRLHVEESGMDTPHVPVIFNKQSSCVTGPYDPIEIPAAAADSVDYEGELGV